MTRINLVSPVELTDQHLFAEFREIKMIPRSLERSLRARGLVDVVARIPKQFTLGTGHVSFFYDKGAYLHHRMYLLIRELDARGVKFDRASRFDALGIYERPDLHMLYGDWKPQQRDYDLIRARIRERIEQKRGWYRYYGKSLDDPECLYLDPESVQA